jgi:YjbE family integral membrane protein
LFSGERQSGAMDDLLSPDFLLALGQIIWINALLSGDNAVVIALACRGLPDNQKKIGVLAGAAAAILLRIVFTAVIAVLLGIPYLKIIGAAALLWIAVDLLKPKPEGKTDVAQSSSLLKAIGTIALADIIMSLDNVIAIAGAAHGDWRLIILGLLISIPLIVAGSALILKIIERFPVVVWLGAALLGFVAGEMLMSDAAVLERIGEPFVHHWERPVAILTAFGVVAAGFLLVRRHRKSDAGA